MNRKGAKLGGIPTGTLDPKYIKKVKFFLLNSDAY